MFLDPVAQKGAEAMIHGRQGKLLVSKCASPDCKALAFWLERIVPVRVEGPPPHTKSVVSMVYPQTGVRIPPADGLEPKEVRLYNEAAAVAPVSPRAGCALVRVLLEAYLKRHLADAGHPADGKPLAKMIELAVQHLDLSPTLKTGLTAIRERGNTAMHDPYGLTDDARAEDLPWLFHAVDELVEELHVKPQKWAGMAET